jgi:hypothetical protein
LPTRTIRWTSCTSTMVAFLAGRALTTRGAFMPAVATGKPVSSSPLAAASRAFAAVSRSTSSASCCVGGLADETQLPESRWSPAGQRVHFIELVAHSAQLESQTSHLPVAQSPYCPFGQNVVQLLPSRKGASELDGHDVHACTSPGEVQVAHSRAHGLQKCVAFSENPSGHSLKHWPRW